MTSPVRLQLSRRKGFDLQKLSRQTNGLDCAKVARPSIFGNPFTIANAADFHAKAGARFGETPRETAVRWFRAWVRGQILGPDKQKPPALADIRRMLAGKNLACWCRTGQVCHADVLLELANA